MEYHVSPFIKAEHTGVQTKPLSDDPYAYVSSMDPLTRHEYYYILKKIEQGWITERDIEIVRFLYVHRWLTLAQISRLFFSETEREATVRNRVRKLIKYGLLRKIQWASYSNPNENRPSYYELGSSGADILKFRFGAFLGHRDPRNPKETTMLFRMKYITTNEFYIQLLASFEVTHFEFHPILTLNDQQQIPTAKYILKNPKGRELLFYLICHREDEKWMKTIRYQAQFFKQYLATEEKAILVVILSTADKAEMARMVLEQEGALEHTWFVTDEDLYNKEVKLSQGFFVFKDGKKVYYDLE
ncbi:replication-relaxation family protein [Bacillus cereus]|uniref:replication-relaxation family protein n=1 Tax=Paenibacillus melissococcoides TaxID=2912268 RepID=UPI0021C29E57|nr:replication-relaxation family protein [Paenibacillus melissococcoides]MEB9896277.1 replication-relaxation family protein [Bacillus cereus]CAH8721291.1 replication-relaxation family protein [Paenibacillus melissococcoides]